MTSLPSADMVRVDVPSRVADLGFSFLRPADWVVAELPDGEIDFSQPATFAPLCVCHASWGAVVWSVGARPAFDDGTVTQWLTWLAREQGFDPGTAESVTIGAHRGAACDAIQVAEGTVLRMRLGLLEDGGRLVSVSAMAPDALWSSLGPVFDAMTRSFALAIPRGPTAAIVPDEPTAPEAMSLATFALAGDASALDPEHPTNARLRDGAVGLVPRLLHTDADRRQAVIGAGSIIATLAVPFGWHAIDDGRRTLLFDGDGRVQIDLRRIALEEGSEDALLDRVLHESLAEQPGMEHLRLELGGRRCLAFRGMVANGENVEQVHLLDAAPRDTVLRARVTASGDDMPRTLDMVDLVLRSVEYLDRES